MYLAAMVGRFVKQVVREWCPSTTGPLLPTITDSLPAHGREVLYKRYRAGELPVPKVPEPDWAATPARAKNKKGPKPPEHVPLSRLKGFSSQKCSLWVEWAGYLVPRDVLPPFCNIVARTERCVQQTPLFGPYFLRTKLFVGHRGGGLTEIQRGRLWRACGQRCVDSKNSQTTPATTSTSSIRQLLGAADAQTVHHATFSTAPSHQLLGSANAETTLARAPAVAADRKQRPNATCEGKNG